jgi:hypothetical protein
MGVAERAGGRRPARPARDGRPPQPRGSHDAFWGARYAIVGDPDRRDVGIMSPSNAEHRDPPPDV